MLRHRSLLAPCLAPKSTPSRPRSNRVRTLDQSAHGVDCDEIGAPLLDRRCIATEGGVMIALRLADDSDIAAIDALMARQIAILQRGFLSTAEIEASRAVTGLAKTPIGDRTYWPPPIDDTL